MEFRDYYKTLGVERGASQAEMIMTQLSDVFVASQLCDGWDVPRGNHSDMGAPWGIYPCDDGWCVITIVDDEHWEGLVRALGRPDWAIDVKEELLFSNPYVVVARKDHPLTSLRALTLKDLGRYDWIMPGPSTPRQQAFERMFAATPKRVADCSRGSNDHFRSMSRQ